jgi:hypothetical protein
MSILSRLGGHVGGGNASDGKVDATADMDFAAMLSQAESRARVAATASIRRATGRISRSEAKRQEAVSGGSMLRGPKMVIPRPKPLTLVLALVALGLLTTFTVIAAITATAMSDLASVVRERQEARLDRIIERPLPPDTVILNDQAFQAHLEADPIGASGLHRRRAQLLAADKRFSEAEAAYRQARMVAVSHPPAELDLEHARVLLDLGQHSRATAMLEDLLNHKLTPAQRAEVKGLLGRIYLAGT